MTMLCAVVLGFVGGLRSMLAPAVVSWAAWVGILPVSQTPLAFMGYHYTHWILTVLAVGELIADKLPMTPSRKALPGFAARIVSGVLTGATIGAGTHTLIGATTLGIAGAVAGTLGGAAGRARLASLLGRDMPAALIEDAVALALSALCVAGLR